MSPEAAPAGKRERGVNSPNPTNQRNPVEDGLAKALREWGKPKLDSHGELDRVVGGRRGHKLRRENAGEI